METLIVYPETPEKLEALKSVMKALGIAFDLDEEPTDYLLQTKSNRERLEESIAEAASGKVVRVGLDEIGR